jgi:hypothetical protein
MNKIIIALTLAFFALSASAWNLPPSGSKMHIQYTGTINLNLPAQVYNVDVFDITAAKIATLHANNKYVICYFSAGSWEDWRPDAAAFPEAVKGNPLDGWEGERWLDVRALSTLIPIMTERMRMGKNKGCDAFDPDNVDGYRPENNSGFPLTWADQQNYNFALTSVAHTTFNKAIGLKNTLDLVGTLVPFYDFAVNEQCHEYNECAALDPFIAAGKQVFQIEYTGTLSAICNAAAAAGRSAQKKSLALNASGTQC